MTRPLTLMTLMTLSRRSGALISSLVATAALLLVPGAFAQDWTVSDDHEWCDSKSWSTRQVCEVRQTDLAATGSLEVDPGSNGGVTVEGWDGNEVQVLVKVQAKRSTDLSDIQITANGNSIRSQGPRQGNWGTSFRIKVPRHYDVDIEAHNGGLSIRGVDGTLKLDTQNGGITLADVGGSVWARTRNGGLDIDLEGSSWQGDGLDAKTTNGGVSLSVPRDYSAELETGTVNGKVRVDFPVTVQGRIGRDIRTTLGRGGATISVMTTNGSVSVKES